MDQHHRHPDRGLKHIRLANTHTHQDDRPGTPAAPAHRNETVQFENLGDYNGAPLWARLL